MACARSTEPRRAVLWTACSRTPAPVCSPSPPMRASPRESWVVRARPRVSTGLLSQSHGRRGRRCVRTDVCTPNQFSEQPSCIACSRRQAPTCVGLLVPKDFAFVLVRAAFDARRSLVRRRERGHRRARGPPMQRRPGDGAFSRRASPLRRIARPSAGRCLPPRRPMRPTSGTPVASFDSWIAIEPDR